MTETELQEIPKTDEEWRQRLTPEQYSVLRKHGTERPFSGPCLDAKDDGTYRCAGCGNPLFASDAKFESGTGWPSFTEALPGSVKMIEDRSYGMARTEVRCARCDGHLGHVFPDGPREAGGMRFCMNGCALDLEKKEG
jgi:peptide-methionine (R)-S-oxide reductase